MEFNNCHRPRQADAVWKRVTFAFDTSVTARVSRDEELERVAIRPHFKFCMRLMKGSLVWARAIKGDVT
jgi:hypothetical protein